MTPNVTAFRLPKHGYSIEECEDALAFDVEHLRFAMADGATESSFSDRWAQALVQAYLAEPPFGYPPGDDALQLWMLPLQQSWRQGINWAALPWFCQEKAERGAYAAFLGLEFAKHGTVWGKIISRTLQGEELAWHAFAVGDTNLFQVRNQQLLTAFPVTRSEDFNSRPILLASNEGNNVSALKDIRSASGGVKPGDYFILATDAIAKWFLTRHEAGETPWQTLAEIRTDDQFADLAARLRKDQGMRNDDTTIIVIRWED